MKVYLQYKLNQHRSQRVMSAFQRSLLMMGHKPWHKVGEADVAIIYGMGPGHVMLRDEFLAAGKPVLILDLGYWRRNYSLGDGAYYKVSLNHHHPNKIITDLRMSSKRFDELGIPIKPWSTNGKHILLAGMGQKSCVLYKYPDQSWDRWAVQEIRKYSNRPILYRPKPSWRGCPHIPGTTYSDPANTMIEEAIDGAHCVVTHHSNVAVDALIRGVPGFTWDGAAINQTSQDLSHIERPFYPTDREQFIHNLAFFNWSVGEIANGECWKFFYKHWLK